MLQTHKKTRCYQCHHRLGLIAMTCKCGQLFCQTHLPAEEHKCTFDYRATGTAQLSTIMVAVRADHGLEKI